MMTGIRREHSSVKSNANAIPEPTQEPEEDHYPEIATDLTDGETVNGDYRTFYVQATDWYGNSLPSTSLEIYGNGERLSSKGEPSTGVFAYRLDLNEGSNTVNIKATDEEGWSTTLPTFTIYKGEDGQDEPAGSITVSIEAGTIGLVRSFRQHRLTIIRENSFPRSFSDCYRIQDLTGEIMEVRQVAFT